MNYFGISSIYLPRERGKITQKQNKGTNYSFTRKEKERKIASKRCFSTVPPYICRETHIPRLLHPGFREICTHNHNTSLYHPVEHHPYPEIQEFCGAYPPTFTGFHRGRCCTANRIHLFHIHIRGNRQWIGKGGNRGLSWTYRGLSRNNPGEWR